MSHSAENLGSPHLFILCDSYYSRIIASKQQLSTNPSLTLLIDDQIRIAVDSSLANQQPALQGINQCWNSDFALNNPCWKLLQGGAVNLDFAKDWTLEGGHTAYVFQGPDHVKEPIELIYHDPVIGKFLPVNPGERYQFGGSFGCHRCDAQFEIQFYDAEKNKVHQQIADIASDQLIGGKKLENYLYLSELTEVPKEASFVTLTLIKRPTKPGLKENHSFFFFTHVFFYQLAANTSLIGWRKTPFSEAEWQSLRQQPCNELVAINLTLPRSIYDGQPHEILFIDEVSVPIWPELSKTFCSLGSSYDWEYFQTSLEKACDQRDWPEAAACLLAWIEENPMDQSPEQLQFIAEFQNDWTDRCVFETASTETLLAVRGLTDLAPEHPCAWRWLLETAYVLSRWQECVDAYHRLRDLTELDSGNDCLINAIVSSLEKVHCHAAAFHLCLSQGQGRLHQPQIERLLSLVQHCPQLQLSDQELLTIQSFEHQASGGLLIAAVIACASSDTIAPLFSRIDNPFSRIIHALWIACCRTEITSDWTQVLALLNAADQKKLLKEIPDWLAVECLWMQLHFETAGLRDKSSQLEKLSIWQAVVSFDQCFPLDRQLINHQQSSGPLLPINALSHFLVLTNSAKLSPHRLFDCARYHQVNQAAEDSLHPLVHFFRYSCGYESQSTRPNPYFDCGWYRQTYLNHDQLSHPLLHYLAHYSEAGLQPSRLFHNDYIRETQALRNSDDPLAYYLEQIQSLGTDFYLSGFSPSPFFDRSYYLQHYPHITQLVRDSAVDPFIHFIEIGHEQGLSAHHWQYYHEFVCHQRLHWEPYNQHSIFATESNLHYIKRAKAETVYLDGQRVLAEQLNYHPLISLIVPVYQVKPRFLREMIDSVRAQTYENWQLCLVDDASSRYREQILALLEQYAAADDRIVYRIREQNGHICHTSNDCLALAQGEYIGLLDHDDVLTPDALYEVAALINHHAYVDIIYSDEDKIDEWGVCFGPYYKPSWSPHTLWSRMYSCHLTVYRKSLINRVGGFRIGFEGSQDYDLMLRCSELTSHIYHIPKVLYHWRDHKESTASGSGAKNYCAEAGRKAVEEAFARRDIKVDVAFAVTPADSVYLARPKVIGMPMVDIIIPSRNGASVLAVCLDSLFSKTDYKHFKVTVIDNNSNEKSFFRLIEQWQEREPQRFQVIANQAPFNFSALNNFAVQQTAGDYLLFLNNDTEIIHPDWLAGMLGYAQLEEIGAVGVKLLYPDDTIQHAGVVTGIAGVAGHVMKHEKRNVTGYFWNLQAVTNYSVVTAACLMVSRTKFERVSGFTEFLKVAFNDVDFCLKLRQQGLYNVYLPFVELYHYESKSRGYEDTDEKRERFEREILFMRQRWGTSLDNDPFYSPWLTLNDESAGYKHN